MISLLALAGVAYLLFKDWQDNKQTNDTLISPAAIQQLKDSNQVLSTDIKNIQVEVKRVEQKTAQISGFEQKILQLSNQITEIENLSNDAIENNQSGLKAANNPFDNSDNERALAVLQKQIADQAKVISDLQSVPLATAEKQVIAHDLLSDNHDQIEKNAAIQVLLKTDVLLMTHRLPQAIVALNNYLKVSGLKPADKNKISRLLDQLKKIDQPDLKNINQQLMVLKSTINDLQVPTETLSNDESKWYDSFVSVKKIDTENNINSTAQMVAFKTELNRMVYQAQLFLMLSDQSGWRSSLKAAAQLIVKEMPENNELAADIKALSEQFVVAVIPQQVSITTLVDQLKGLR